jgi:hypothetical protein
LANCINHPWIETAQACANCGQPFCDSCLVEFLGQRYCGPCRDQRLAQMQGPQVAATAPFAGTGTVDMGRWLNAGWELIRNDLLTFGVASFLAVLLSVLSCYVLLGPMICGMYMMAFRKLTHGTVEVGNLFDGFRRFLWAFLGMLLMGVVVYVPMFILQIPMMVISFTDPNNVTGTLLATGFYYVTAIPLSVLVGGATLFVFPHIAARNANPVDAFAASFQVFRRNILMFALCSFVFSLVMQLGVCAVCIGLFITVPMVVAAIAQAYADHFGVAGWDQA